MDQRLHGVEPAANLAPKRVSIKSVEVGSQSEADIERVAANVSFGPQAVIGCEARGRMVLSDCIYVENRGSVSLTGRLSALRDMAMPGAEMTTLTLDDRIKAEQLKQEIRKLESDQGEIAARFAAYARCSVEEQLALRLAFAENRKRIGHVSQELFRLVC